MRVGILGGTGFVGSYLVDALLERGHQPVLLVRPGSEDRVNERDRCEIISGQISDEAAVRSMVAAVEAVIYNIGILREFPSRGITFEALHWRGAELAIDLAKEAGGKRFLLMSANGVRPDGTGYQRTKYQAEEHLRSTNLEHTIFRPSVIFGQPRGRMEFATQLCEEVIHPPFPAPLFYSGLLPLKAGGFKMSPVHVTEVAAAFADAVGDKKTIGKTFGLCGPEDLTWRKILERIAAAAGKPNKLTVPVPADLLRLSATMLDRFEAFPVTADQLRMLMEGNTCAGSANTDVLSGHRHFDEAELAYLSSSA